MASSCSPTYFLLVFLLSLISLKTMGQDLAKKVNTLYLSCHKSSRALEFKFRSVKIRALLKDGLYKGLTSFSENSCSPGHVPSYH